MSTRTTAALIGAAGLVLGAIVSNVGDIYRQFFPPNNYRPTGVFETELRYYYEVSGARATIEDLQDQLIDSQVTLLLTQLPENRDVIERIANATREETPEFSEIIDVMAPIFERYFTVEEMQELNRFYSTEIIQGMIIKERLVNTEAAPIMAQMQQDIIRRIIDNFNTSTLESILRP